MQNSWIPYQVNNCRHNSDGVEKDFAINVGHSKDVNKLYSSDGNEEQTKGELEEDQDRPRYPSKRLINSEDIVPNTRNNKPIGANLPLLLDK